jgi:7,8-dihydropterin-6-yl-methyl-4-(beta-D-ribofuranosyl)aminobenzene 5'-phosphate synthase
MKLTVLNDNSAGPKFLATHGLSFYIEADINILFDTGPDNTFLENAKRLGLELRPGFTVLSHGHWDHGNGLKYSSGNTLVYHPDCFTKRYSKSKDIFVGLSLNEEILSKNYKLITSVTPLKLSPKVTFLGEIPRVNDFEAKHTDFTDEKGKEDFIPDDTALTVATVSGLVIVSGCAHAGICNTIEYAMKVTGENRIEAVFGGFHLKSDGEPTQKTLKYFKDHNIKKAYPSHCTSLPALSEFYRVFKLPQVLTGNYYSF